MLACDTTECTRPGARVAWWVVGRSVLRPPWPLLPPRVPLVPPRRPRCSLLAPFRTPLPLPARPHPHSARAQAKELAVGAAIADIHARFGRATVPHYIISNCASLSDLLEVAVLLKEAGLVIPASTSTPGAGPTACLQIIPLFETIDDLRAGGAVMAAAFRLPAFASLVASNGGLQVRSMGAECGCGEKN